MHDVPLPTKLHSYGALGLLYYPYVTSVGASEGGRVELRKKEGEEAREKKGGKSRDDRKSKAVLQAYLILYQR